MKVGSSAGKVTKEVMLSTWATNIAAMSQPGDRDRIRISAGCAAPCGQHGRARLRRPWRGGDSGPRSEEHTSELQSPMSSSYAVFCLKKKKNIDETNILQ